MRRKICSKLLTAVSIIMLLSSAAIPTFFADTNTADNASLSLVYSSEDSAIQGGEFSVWRFADVTESLNFNLSGDFADAPVSLFEMNPEKWSDLTVTLDGYAVENEIAPLETKVTNTDGRLTFDAVDSTGLYLISGKAQKVGDYTYIPSSFVVMLPTKSGNDSWIYSVTAEVKFKKEYTPDLTDIEVTKVWENTENNIHPDSVTVHLIKDDEIFESVELNEENNWTHAFTNLVASSKYALAEVNVPDGYTFLVSEENNRFTVTNTKVSEKPTEATAENTTQSPSAAPTAPSNSQNLPQTGTMLWLVPILFAAGCLLMIAGIVLKKLQK